MTKFFTILCCAFLFPVFLLAQSHQVRGVVTDANSGETLIGATISFKEGKGVITDMDGRYFIKIEPGNYHLRVSYVGYLPQEIDIEVKETDLTQNFQLKTPTLTEVEVVADVAKTRETPVAFSTVQPIKLQEELASRDIPMILNKTPGVYATQQGGGDGDARINIRGFSQRNLAVMIDGIPVNDMENGWVYWSNWFGLDAVTRSIQVQRGLGASKLGLPSVGGTMNIISKGIDANLGGTLKQEVGADGYLRTSFGLTSGLLKHGWGITLAGSYKQGNGWVDNTWTKGWFGYLRVDKRLGKHTITFSAMGAPQEHAQRAYQKSIATFDKYGIRYNSNWGHLDRWTQKDTSGKPIYSGRTENLSQSLNYFFKPQISLRDFWRINDKLYLSNILYVSVGNGGGTTNFSSTSSGSYGTSTFNFNQSDGLINYQSYYDRNMNDPTHRSEGIIRSSVNNHRWYGLLSTFSWEINSKLSFSGGIDLRTYKGQHYGEVYDLLGGNFVRDDANQNINPYQTKFYKGDKIYYYNDALVRWGGVFTQLEYKTGNWTSFINLTLAESAYQRIDYFKKKDLVISGNTFATAVGYGDIFYYNGSENLTYHAYDTKYTSNDTVFVVKQNGKKKDTLFIVNPKAYNNTSSEARATQTKWKVFPGYTFKGGLNYNLDKRNNVFLNLGYLSKAPRFANVFNNANQEILNPKNEVVQAIELGYSLNTKKIALNVNTYLIKWNNKPLDSPLTYTDPKSGDSFQYNINGIDELHKGVEIEFGYKPIPSLQWDQVVAWGDWRFTSGGTADVFDPTGNHITSLVYNAKGVHVGDAAQFQFMESMRWEIIKYLYVSASVTLFDKNYSQMDPTSLTKAFLDKDGNPRDSWKMPMYYLVEMNAGKKFTFKNFKLDLRASVLNLFDKVYIADAKNNDSYSTTTSNFDAASAGVYYGIGRTFNLSLAISY
ncbi:MAG: TonB-dependent receptor [Bacteroidota bacterium]